MRIDSLVGVSALTLLLVFGDHAFSKSATQQRVPVCGYRVVNTYPHDPEAYTQGLIYRDGFLFESTGLQGRSSLRKVELETGKVVREVAVHPDMFAEGLTDWKDVLVQLTWHSKTGFVYDLLTLSLRDTFTYTGEGWGLTHDGTHLILSDGSEHLRFIDPHTFEETTRIAVTDSGVPVRNLNELEYVGNEVYANIWHSDRIARVSPTSGRVTAWIDLGGLLPEVYLRDPEAVLNGIAYDEGRRRLFVTGKLWPRLFEIEVRDCQ